MNIVNIFVGIIFSVPIFFLINKSIGTKRLDAAITVIITIAFFAIVGSMVITVIEDTKMSVINSTILQKDYVNNAPQDLPTVKPMQPIQDTNKLYETSDPNMEALK